MAILDRSQVKRVLLGLPELPLRLAWLDERLRTWPLASVATLLDGLCEESERTEPDARETVAAIALLFVSLGECEFVARLREEAAGRHLLSLDRLLRRGPPGPADGRLPEDLPVPDYGAGRELTVGERRSLARRPHRRAFEKLLADPHPLVIRQLLVNPLLTESDVVRMAARRPARLVVMQELAQAPRWLARTRVRMSVLLNPGAPPETAIPLLALCNRPQLLEVLESADTALVLRGTARELFERRPPLREPDNLRLQ